MNARSLELKPIGVILTPYLDRYRAPRQAAAADAAEGIIELLPGHNFEQALDDLIGFERIWIIAWLHRMKGWKTKVLPPREATVKRGVFATRSPHRPNPIGLSAATLLEIKGRTLRVGGIDLLDGTPILDIKPYIPYADAIPDSRAGWLDEVEQKSGALFQVQWSPLAAEQSLWLEREHAVNLRAWSEKVLARDAAPHPYRRISVSGDQLQLAIKSWRILFSKTGTTVNITSLRSGYAHSELSTGRKLHDDAAHAAFHSRWPAPTI